MTDEETLALITRALAHQQPTKPRESVIGKLFIILFMVIIAVCFVLLALNNVGLLTQFVPAAQTTVNGVAPAARDMLHLEQSPALQSAPRAQPYLEQPPAAAPLPTVPPAPVAAQPGAEAAPASYWTPEEEAAFAATTTAFYDPATLPTPAPAFVQAAIGGDDGAKACGGSPLCGGMTNAELKATMEVKK